MIIRTVKDPGPEKLTRRLCKHDIGYRGLKYWTAEEDASLLAQFKAGIPYPNMRIEGRTDDACRKHLKRLIGGGIRNHAWTEAEVAELRRQYLETGYISGICIPGRKQDAIFKKLQRLREAGELF